MAYTGQPPKELFSKSNLLDSEYVPRSEFETNKIINPQAYTEAEKGQIRSNASLSTLSGFRNKFINPDMSIVQRSASINISPSSSGIVADRWRVYNGTDQIANVFVQPAAIGTSLSPSGERYLTIRFATAPTSGGVELSQRIENVETLAGKLVTLTAFTRSSDTINLNAFARQYFGTGGSPSDSTYQAASTGNFAGDPAFRYKKSALLTLPSVSNKVRGTNNNDYLNAGFSFVPRTASSYLFDDLSIVEGDATLEDDPTSRRHIQQELALCQRYYCVTYGALTYYSASAGHSLSALITWPVQMRSTPSVSFVGTKNTANVSDLYAYTITSSNFKFEVKSLAAGLTYVDSQTITADSEL